MSLLAIITARGGSKRIPKKNIKNFMGKPMLAYAINTAIESEIFDEVMVSTEDDEIAEIALKYGAKVPFKRSEKTANDFAITRDVLEEVLTEYEKRGKHFAEYCCIFPCIPLLNGGILKEAYKTFKAKNADILIPVVRFSFPIQRAFRINAEGFLEYREKENALKRSQDLEPMYQDAGMFSFYKNKDKQINIDGYAVPFEIEEKYVQDIDNISDLEIAEIKYNFLYGKK